MMTISNDLIDSARSWKENEKKTVKEQREQGKANINM